jgi:hypothetical protein
MAQTILERLTIDGQIAFVFAAVLLTGIALVLMLWRPRHATYRPHDCRTMGCKWLEDSPRVP